LRIFAGRIARLRAESERLVKLSEKLSGRIAQLAKEKKPK
jgi:hypothetical protein